MSRRPADPLSAVSAPTLRVVRVPASSEATSKAFAMEDLRSMMSSVGDAIGARLHRLSDCGGGGLFASEKGSEAKDE